MDPVEERLASFYLGQAYDLSAGRLLDAPVHYDARDLTTHAVCLGMTGSGKTGLGIILLEEAVLDGIPSLVIDPKGDMTNLLLTFPELRPEDFRPWVNPDDARRKDMDLDSYAVKIADQWRNGLAGTGQGQDRIRRLKDAADFAIYTPGSSAGRELSILQTFKAPTLDWESEGELIRDKVESVVSALLALIGIQADPVRSREHILLSNIFTDAWRAGEDLDLAQLIMRIQKPPFSQLGVFPLDTFFPEKDRMALAMLLNGLVASPAFVHWIKGQPLEVSGLLRSPSGKPQVSILYIAHLSEAEREFFVTLLLEQVVSWMRAQSGTTSLRALLYMDEMFGYLPPHPANPPTKKPFLTLLKQARAFGLGLVLATQNPVDLDYKALTNAGTWFIGRMQADRDKQRLLDGLEGVQVTAGGTSRAQFDRMISALGSRVFLLHNVHEDEPVVFHTRWAMSYLRGPMTRQQIQELVAEQAPAPAQAGLVAAPAQVARPERPEPAVAAGLSRMPPQLPSSVKQVFLPARVSVNAALAELGGARIRASGRQAEDAGSLVYQPGLLGSAKLRFVHTKSRQTHTEEVAYLLPLEGQVQTLDWSMAQVDLDPGDLDSEPERDAHFAQLPSEMGDSRRYTALRKEFEDYLYYHSAFTLRYNPHVDLYSEPGEDKKEFQRRCRRAAEDAHETEAAKLEAKYDRERKRIEDKLEREKQELRQDKIKHDSLKQEELLGGVESVVGLLTGRRSSSRLTTASRKRRMTRQAREDVEESERTIEALEDELEELEREEQQELEELKDKWAELIDDVENVEVRPRRTDVQLGLFALAWRPYWQVMAGDQVLSVPAFKVEPV
ncbi:MAG: helicase HerA domain-containing protein [Anaerolineae bacterium]